MINFSCTKKTMVFVTNFVFLIQFDCLFVMMEICLFWAPVIHFDFDTTSGKTDGKLLTGMKNHFDTAEFSS